MTNIIIPKGYQTPLSIRDTEIFISLIKDYFENSLKKHLNLTRVNAPLFVYADTGINDNLNGVESPVSFEMKMQSDRKVEIVHSLAKWKRLALKRYGFLCGEGIFADMKAIRSDELVDNIHSVYVDQWDWEFIITKEERTLHVLKKFVKKIYNVIKETEDFIAKKISYISPILPDNITFISTVELEKMYPTLTTKEREYKIAKKYGAVFLMQIGEKLSSGEPHDGRAPDYDDWKLNGDILVYYLELDIVLELSSMGIRVDGDSLNRQLKAAGCEERKRLPFQKMVINEEVPYTIGGGIGQSRIFMFLLRMAHIGEVQVSVWPEKMVSYLEQEGIHLL